MLNKELSEDRLKRAKLRFRILNEFLKEKDYADVIRTCQEIVEIIQKSILIKIGINPPKWQDVIDIILENKDRLPSDIAIALNRQKKTPSG
ncbi:HEPN domain-containing protein [Thermodesulfovibrio sp. Kuro-1]|uniref:HEPN domain-containing protein n=1 Tax=Thermodesulfovibrio sp. Kuro-1 TaxID=2580394 RepID=UPI001141EA97|nr:HEPN domain-containing protein [Thermodesulfovibrio sp. Kuro-1]